MDHLSTTDSIFFDNTALDLIAPRPSCAMRLSTQMTVSCFLKCGIPKC